MWKVVLTNTDGTTVAELDEDDDERAFESESAAADYGLEWVNNYNAGGNAMHDDYEDEDIEIEVFQV